MNGSDPKGLAGQSAPEEQRKQSPELATSLRRHSIMMPDSIYQCSGIRIMGTRIKSVIFTTDVAILANNNAQAVLCVYPFTPQLNITTAVINMARCPVFVGVGGGKTSGGRSIQLALQAELLGAYGVVVNAPMSNPMITRLSDTVDIPVIATVTCEKDDYMGKVKAGAGILNVSAAAQTPALVRLLRRELGPDYPIMATGGPKDETILQTIEAGANAITYTPPTTGDIFEGIMTRYRSRE